MSGSDIFVPIFLFGGAALVLYKYYDGRHKERMAMIEKGMSPEQMRGGAMKHFMSNPLSSLKWGLVALFVGGGVFTGNWLRYTMMIDEEPAFFGSVLVWGGVALVVYYFIAARKMQKEG